MSSRQTIERPSAFRRGARLLPFDYLAWLCVAMAFAGAADWMHGPSGRTVIQAEVARFLGALLCVGIAERGLRHCRGETRSAGVAWTPVIATAAIMAIALAVLLRRGSPALTSALPSAPLLCATVILLAYAEEVYFREALPSRLMAAIGTGAGSFAFAALASQFLYAAAHLPAMLLGRVPMAPIAVSTSLGEKMGFGLLLFILDPGGQRRVERVIIHSTVNLSLILAPAALPAPLWRGGLLCLLGGIAMRLARWRAAPSSDYPSAWQLANAVRHVRAPR